MTGDQPVKRADEGRPVKRQCQAHTPTGARCRLSAIHGGTVCHKHGASAGQVKAAAARRVTEARALEVAARYYSPNGGAGPVDVPAALAGIIGEIRHFSAFMGQRLSELTESEWHYSHPDRDKIRAEVGLYERALDRAGRVLVDVARLGVEAAIAGQAERLETARATRIVEAIQVCFEVVDLSVEQRKRAAGGLSAMLIYLAGPGADG